MIKQLFRSLKKKKRITILTLELKEQILRGHQTNKNVLHVLATLISLFRILQSKESK